MSASDHIIGYSRADYLAFIASEYNNALALDPKSNASAHALLREYLNFNGASHNIPLGVFERSVDFLLSLALLINPAFELPKKMSWLKQKSIRAELPARQKAQSIYGSLSQEASSLLSSVRRRVYKTTAGWHPRLGRIENNSKRTLQLLGCNPQELRRHIELQFLPGMGWHNRTEWHVDHIVALASAQSQEELIQLFHFTNLRPLWGVDNLKKSAKKLFLI